MDAVLLCPRCADPWYRRTVRVSMGQVLAVPFARLAPWPDGLAAVRRAGFQLLAMTPQAGSVELGRVRLDDTERVAVLLGAEGPGLSGGALAAADRAVRIPMRPGVDSLGVASAASIAFHRLGRV
jgi:tRNA G18 (ribose-2'-O)-methylase SpoU